jgi:hypothetical protein
MASENSSPPARAERLPDELTPEPYSAAGSRSNGSTGLTAPDEDCLTVPEVAEHWPATRRSRQQAEGDWPAPDNWPLPFEVRLAETRAALARLQARIAAECPGPHEYTAHRDRKPPWCDACGYSDVGLHRREVNLQ